MRLKRLELQGFKSFLDRTILNFDPGITGVVGPNGCGKSNIVDAIQWVMGEQSAKHLRGENMTDVIFNGSDHKAATSMAEVSLVLDRQGIALSPGFAAFDKCDEIAVTRRVYRDGSGEFLINKTPCRLKDIHELFMDTGVGRRAYSIIEQGQIDRMINVKPEDRRFLFEEVAGITKYKIKRKEAERKLEMTRANLTRLQDILNELEKQIRSLKVQATRARKYRELKTELEEADLFLLGRSLYTHKRALDEIQVRRDELVAIRAESDALAAQLDADVAELEFQKIDQEKAYQQLSERERDLSDHIQKLEANLGLLEERRRHLSETQEVSRLEETEIQEAIQASSDDIQNTTTERDGLGETLSTLHSQLSEKEVALRNFQEQRFRANQRKDSLQGKRNQLSNRRVALENQKLNGQSKEQESQERRAELDSRLVEQVTALDAHAQALLQVDGRMEDCTARTTQASSEASERHSECQETSARLSELEESLFKARENFHSKRSRLESLEELQENLEGYSPSAREILTRLEGTGISATPMAEILAPEAEIEDHLEALLGAEMNTLLVKTTEEAESLARMINERGMERVRILALADIEGKAQTAPGVAEATAATPLLNRIRVKAGYEAAAQWWLGNAFLSEDLNKLFALRGQYPNATWLTSDSRTIGHSDRSITSGSLPTKSGVFARRREIEELTVACQGFEAEVARLSAERESLLTHLQTQERLHAQLKDKLSSLHVESVEIRKEKEKIQFELSRIERDHQSLRSELERNQQQLNDLRMQFEKWDADLLQLGDEEVGLAQELEEASQEIENAGRDFEALGNAINEAKIERSRLEEKRNGLEYKLEKLKRDLEQLSHRRENLLSQRARDQKELENLDGNRAEVERQKTEETEERNQILVQISDVKNAFNDTCSSLNEVKDRAHELQKKRSAVLTEIQELELRGAQEQAAFEQVRGLSLERYQQEARSLDETALIDLEKLPLFAATIGVDWDSISDAEKCTLLQDHLKTIREKVNRYGEVNLTAIQEFDEVQKRYDFLMEQRTDLDKSIGILEEAIKKIDESTRQRFEETFYAVNAKFKEIFPILFNGGKAELTLTQAENVLDAGVDIMVHPPGKRPASITLLSGGEKALTAVSLILAIFARKPSPFCLLDEVDAPLDDANVSRFNTVVKKMAEKTQFIVITHNKKTMEIAEALYGVTMERPGISKMTSVRLN